MKKIISALLILTMLVSMVCVSTSAAGIHVNMNFESMEVFTSQFVAGQFFVDDAGLLYGWAEAKALQTHYTQDDNGFFDGGGLTWLTYDATITLSVKDDNLSEGDRWINLVYCNDNLPYEGRAEDRVQMAFSYDIQERCFRFTPGWNNTTAEEQLMTPVYREIDTDGEDFFTMGISVEKDRIRCFYNDELIFDFQNTEYLIANALVSPFLFWQDGNYVEISNITVADQGYLFPEIIPDPGSSSTETPEPDVSSTEAPDPDVTGGTDAPDPENPGTNAPNPENPGTNAPVNNGGNAGNASDADNNAGNNAGNAGTEAPSTTGTVAVEVTDDKGQTVTDDKGEKVTSISVVTDPAPADTNKNKPSAGNATATGDATFVVIAAMVATLGCAVVIKKVSVK